MKIPTLLIAKNYFFGITGRNNYKKFICLFCYYCMLFYSKFILYHFPFTARHFCEYVQQADSCIFLTVHYSWFINNRIFGHYCQEVV